MHFKTTAILKPQYLYTMYNISCIKATIHAATFQAAVCSTVGGNQIDTWLCCVEVRF